MLSKEQAEVRSSRKMVAASVALLIAGVGALAFAQSAMAPVPVRAEAALAALSMDADDGLPILGPGIAEFANMTDSDDDASDGDYEDLESEDSADLAEDYVYIADYLLLIQTYGAGYAAVKDSKALYFCADRVCRKVDEAGDDFKPGEIDYIKVRGLPASPRYYWLCANGDTWRGWVPQWYVRNGRSIISVAPQPSRSIWTTLAGGGNNQCMRWRNYGNGRVRYSGMNRKLKFMRF
jgi:hypothetical protein